MKKWSSLLFTTAIFCTFISARKIPMYSKADLLGDVNPEWHDDFVRVPDRYCNKTTYIREDVYNAFLKMYRAAAADNVNLYIVSGTRNRQRQIEIWSDKWQRYTGSDIEKAEEILLYSSMPGTSRHHWGTDIDLNSVEPHYFADGTGAEIYTWLNENAENFGFFQPYIKKGEERKEGYREEKWHWSYYPVANQLLNAYKRIITYDDIKGFPGSEIAPKIDVFNRFVLGVPDMNAKYNGHYLVEQ